MSGKELPGHIAALLQRQNRDGEGRAADSAGITWQGRDLSGGGNPLHTFDGDDGLAAPALVRAREALIAGEAAEADIVAALAGVRLFVPVLATGEGDAEHGDKQAEISLISIRSNDGRQTMPVFSSVEALTGWHPEARPVAAETERVMLAALAEDAELVVLDPRSEFPFVLRTPALTALAQGKPWTPSYADLDVAQELEGILPECPGVLRLEVRPAQGIASATASGEPVAGGGVGPELLVGVVPEPGLDDVDVRLAVASVQAALGDLQLLRERADSVTLTVLSPQPPR
ncbi:SseB family protein [Nesterenkonia lacusekhoensis]|uniref:SseB protein N-terminal domain-containing protein n=1 Tax=Nesterenkonia lacusekhoensis TaxID=150832 RepID=A0ABS4T5B0_9MICC|nr:SseB family protein [Nesterenkonia lacusekhoensis]MBP2318476.1 hypothetical protein [Nesterenkonia lacusekhoensis]